MSVSSMMHGPSTIPCCVIPIPNIFQPDIASPQTFLLKLPSRTLSQGNRGEEWAAAGSLHESVELHV